MSEYNEENICPYHPCHIPTSPERCFGNYKSCTVYSRTKTIRIRRGNESTLVLRADETSKPN